VEQQLWDAQFSPTQRFELERLTPVFFPAELLKIWPKYQQVEQQPFVHLSCSCDSSLMAGPPWEDGKSSIVQEFAIGLRCNAAVTQNTAVCKASCSFPSLQMLGALMFQCRVGIRGLQSLQFEPSVIFSDIEALHAPLLPCK
jgi:hypothetical protein